jgi:hypothetical protein
MDANGYTAGILYLLFDRSVWKHAIRSLITHTDSTYPCDLSRAAERGFIMASVQKLPRWDALGHIVGGATGTWPRDNLDESFLGWGRFTMIATKLKKRNVQVRFVTGKSNVYVAELTRRVMAVGCVKSKTEQSQSSYH